LPARRGTAVTIIAVADEATITIYSRSFASTEGKRKYATMSSEPTLA
jgi:hypothetical protein